MPCGTVDQFHVHEPIAMHVGLQVGEDLGIGFIGDYLGPWVEHFEIDDAQADVCPQVEDDRGFTGEGKGIDSLDEYFTVG